MPAYRFHLVQEDGVVRDEEGRHLSSDMSVADVAVAEALGILSHDARAGHIDLRQRILVEDEAGRLVYSLLFADALAITRFTPISTAAGS